MKVKMKFATSLLLTLVIMLASFASAFARNENPPSPNVIALTLDVSPRGQTVTRTSLHPYRASWKISFQGQPGQSFCFHVDYGDGFQPWMNCGYVSGEQDTLFHDFNHPGDPSGKRYKQSWWAEGVGGPSAPGSTYVI